MLKLTQTLTQTHTLMLRVNRALAFYFYVSVFLLFQHADSNYTIESVYENDSISEIGLESDSHEEYDTQSDQDDYEEVTNSQCINVFLLVQMYRISDVFCKFILNYVGYLSYLRPFFPYQNRNDKFVLACVA